jgi:hypothetical protein
MLKDMVPALWQSASGNVYCLACLSGGARERLMQYKRHRETQVHTSMHEFAAEASTSFSEFVELQNNVSNNAKTNIESSFCLAHISQTLGQCGGRMRQRMLTSLRNSLVWSFAHE